MIAGAATMTGGGARVDAPAKPPRYRADIDGLRAMAVLSVIGFHAFPYSMKGGFVGVDIFFVISGYLISTIIFNGLRNGTFSFAEFYSRRVRRIFPALAIVLLAAYAIGWFVLVAEDYGQLGKHIAGGSGFVSNFLFWNEAGYFTAGADTKPLLHLWSLGIEEQFYIVWPLLLYWVWKRRESLPYVMAAIIIGSFAINIVHSRTDATADFYSPLSRFWELLMGAVLAHLTLRKTALRAGFQNLKSFAGLALIGSALLFLDNGSPFPSWRALLPTVGAFLVISAGADAWPNRMILSRREVVWFGLISYPLYLWHWPLLSYARIVELEQPSRSVRIAAVLASIFLAWLTFRLIEKPIRSAGRTRYAVGALGMVLGLILIGGAGTYYADGFPRRAINRDERLLFLADYEKLYKSGLSRAYREECDFYVQKEASNSGSIDGDCTRMGEKGTYFLWGDSHAQALSLGIRSLLPDSLRLAQVATSSCSPSFAKSNQAQRAETCDASNAFAAKEIRRIRPAVVFLAQKDNHERTDWGAMADAIHAAGGGKVVLLGPVPEWLPSLPEVIVKNYWGTGSSRAKIGLDPQVFDTDAALARKYGESSKLTYVSLASRLCNADGCLATVPGVEGLNLMAVDYGHLSPKGSAYVVTKIIRPALESMKVF
ncbi:MAG: acyltransferase family protein [Elusimicrobia bacterium]|nr:acyltransferase family protein [Elusimicrobiota bacterium]